MKGRQRGRGRGAMGKGMRKGKIKKGKREGKRKGQEGEGEGKRIRLINREYWFKMLHSDVMKSKICTLKLLPKLKSLTVCLLSGGELGVLVKNKNA